MDQNNAIMIMGGGLICENGKWRTAGFNEGDEHGTTGDRLRVEAGALLYKADPDLLVITSGGKGELEKIPGAPTVAEINKKELIELGVKESSIIEDNLPRTTYGQLRNINEILAKYGINKIKIISNRYHLPRIKAMAQINFELKRMLDCGEIRLQSAEAVLLKYEPEKWRNYINRAYGGKEIKKRIALERKGVRDIREGKYKFET